MFLTVATTLACILASPALAQSNCGAPAPVANVKAQDTTNTSTHLSWQPPASTECLDHYKITYCSLGNEEDNCVMKTAVLPLNTTQYDITDLKPCSTNTIQVYTVGTDGNETFTELILYTGSGDPPKVVEVSIKYVATYNITIYWPYPKDYDDACYPGFRVCYSAKGDSKATCSYTIYSQFSMVSDTPLSPCAEYNFSVAIVDGNFDENSKTSVETFLPVVKAPEMPSVSVEVHNHTAHATWQTPDAVSMSCATGYLVENCHLYKQNCTTVFSQTLPHNATEATITGLDSCSYNHVSVNIVGRGGQFSTKGVIIQDKYSEIPAPTEASLREVRNNKITVHYDKEASDCVTSCRVCWFTEGEPETCRHGTYEGTFYQTTTTFSDIHLKPCSNYTMHFTALDKSGMSSENTTTTFVSGPDNMLDESVKVKQDYAMLSWKMAPSALQCGTNFNIAWKKSNENDVGQNVVLPLNVTNYNITGLASCTQYDIMFSTLGHNGSSSGDYSFKILSQIGEIPTFSHFRFFYVYDRLELSVERFETWMYCINSFDTCWYESAETQSNEQCEQGKVSWDSGALKACVNYTFVVTATTSAFWKFSVSDSFITGPARITDLKASENSTTRAVTLSWTNPPNNLLCVEYIKVTYYMLGDNVLVRSRIPYNATTTTVTDLSPCTTYNFDVEPVLSGVDSSSAGVVQLKTSCNDTESLSGIINRFS